MKLQKQIKAYQKAAQLIALLPKQPAVKRKDHFVEANKMIEHPRGWHHFINKVVAYK